MAKNDAGASKAPGDEAASAAVEEDVQARAKAEEQAAYAAAQAESQRLLQTAGTGTPPAPLSGPELGAADPDAVMCFVPKRVPLTLDAEDGHRRVEFVPGTYAIPRRLATEYPNKDVNTGRVTQGMHWYLAAHGVRAIERQAMPAK